MTLVVQTTPSRPVSKGSYLTEAYTEISQAIQVYLGSQSINVTIAGYLILSSSSGSGRRLHQAAQAPQPPAQHFIIGFNVSFPSVAQLSTTFADAAGFAADWNTQSSQYLATAETNLGSQLTLEQAFVTTVNSSPPAPAPCVPCEPSGTLTNSTGRRRLSSLGSDDIDEYEGGRHLLQAPCCPTTAVSALGDQLLASLLAASSKCMAKWDAATRPVKCMLINLQNLSEVLRCMCSTVEHDAWKQCSRRRMDVLTCQ